MEKRTNEEWVTILRSNGDRQAQALKDLRALLAERLLPVFAGRFESDNTSLEEKITPIIEKTLSIALENLDAFDGHSEFITWVFKIGVRQALYEFRHQRWQGSSMEAGFPEIPPGMYDLLERDDFMLYLHRALNEELTEKQRTAIRAMIMLRMPKEDVMKRLGMERCEYFKMIHDARLRLKRRLEKDGWLSKRQGEENQAAPVEL